MPLQVIITAANTVSRASADVLGPPSTISVTMRATSMTVTATARTSEPNGSPTRWAMTSAWCTAARTAPARQSATTATANAGSSRPQLKTSASAATTGTTTVHRVASDRTVALAFMSHTLPEPVRGRSSGGGRTAAHTARERPSQYGSRSRRL